ncbi:hypothetical protein C7T35_33740 [Variovorax sp. WS11]|uniref:patatin-like phospholipase family protein n=1 Tax=Variovorax sp. WS11 TaxID=1105204 RepID=UPI000D0D63AE|nr:patatin-like phospholipase family protein [Variovorax sp. WS11]NDZ13850.1 hypothetical protein [Variovorax sp. WS11]PSL80150.1 hypothetical protein C7T35_33740 [Variovorax sp. WS11]
MDERKEPELPYCDLVMKGGITSGVVYPRLLARLSASYRFKNIGGTSAGAIAAAGSAAAEFGRSNGHRDGFAKLATLPDALGADVEGARGSRLRHLFQPSRPLSRHFDVLLAALNRANKTAMVMGALGTLLLRYWGLVLPVALVTLAIVVALARSTGAMPWSTALLIALAGSALWLTAGWLVLWRPSRATGRLPSPTIIGLCWLTGVLAGAGALALAGTDAWERTWPADLLAAFGWSIVLAGGVLLALALCAWRFGLTLVKGLCANFWGLCSGRSQDGPVEGLTDWLTGYFNDLAGIEATARPLTLGDLWDGARHSDQDVEPKSDTPLRERRINLEVMTSAISRRMCHAIPFKPGAPAYYFDKDEWSRIFPQQVMSWLEKTSDALQSARPDGEQVRTQDGKTLFRLPHNRHLPIVVLVRMSLSFPVLLSAVPMYAIDYSGKTAMRQAKRVWFSDGGIASNMPLHFFDELLPQHPTFAVNLKDEDPVDHAIAPGKLDCTTDTNRVYLPNDNRKGLQQFWLEPEASPAGITQFLWSIVATMQNWRDEIQLPMPGYRDRIVQIAQKADEGGLNLDMPAGPIGALGDAGDCAAQRLVARFATAAGSGIDEDGWKNHKAQRLRTFLALMEDLARHPAMQDPGWDQLIADPELGYNANEKALAQEIRGALNALGLKVEASGATLLDKAPRPRPSLRVVPRI